VSGISKLFQSLENLLIGQEPALHKKSLFGRFSVQIFRMVLFELVYLRNNIILCLGESCLSVN